MKRAEYLEFHKKMCDRMMEITAAKNADYTGGSDIDDAFANFRQVELAGICSVEIGFMTRISDKISRIASFVKKGVLLVKDESIEDTLLDAANYLILMAGYIRSKKNAMNANAALKGPRIDEPMDELEEIKPVRIES